MKTYWLVILLISFSQTNAQDTAATFGDSRCYYETDGTYKSLGIKLQLQRPCEWLPYTNQGMVQGFYFHAGNNHDFMQYLIIEKIPKRFAKENIDTLFTEGGLKKLSSELGYFFLSGQTIMIDTIKVANLVYKSSLKQGKTIAFYYVAEYLFVYKAKVVKLTFKTKAPSEADAARMFEEHKSFFQELANTITVLPR